MRTKRAYPAPMLKFVGIAVQRDEASASYNAAKLLEWVSTGSNNPIQRRAFNSPRLQPIFQRVTHAPQQQGSTT